jgi:hypothetical protein
MITRPGNAGLTAREACVEPTELGEWVRPTYCHIITHLLDKVTHSSVPAERLLLKCFVDKNNTPCLNERCLNAVLLLSNSQPTKIRHKRLSLK